jgi:D-glycero-D-manno-heptose 1,7-bisphosphate phosphatase
MPKIKAQFGKLGFMTNENKGIIFLDRDGVLNKERGAYTFLPEDFEVIPGVTDALRALKAAGYLLIVITNQGGIAKGIYTQSDMDACHQKLHNETAGSIDAIYYSPYHPDYSKSIGRKPGTLLFERALARFACPPHLCWMVGDQERDLIPAKQLGMQTLMVGINASAFADFIAADLSEAVPIIFQKRYNPAS